MRWPWKKDLDSINTKLEAISMTLDDLKAQVEANISVEHSAVAAFNGLADQIKAAALAGDPAKIQALADELKASANALGAAVTANTPAAPPAPAAAPAPPPV
jgi:hypothetical protein